MPEMTMPTPKEKNVHAIQVEADLASLPEKAAWTDVEKIALSARILASEGHFGGPAGQLTVRRSPRCSG
jgi:hypothetical protein